MLGNSSLRSCTGSGAILWSRGKEAWQGPSLQKWTVFFWKHADLMHWPHGWLHTYGNSCWPCCFLNQVPSGLKWSVQKHGRVGPHSWAPDFVPPHPNTCQVATSHQVWGMPVSPLDPFSYRYRACSSYMNSYCSKWQVHTVGTHPTKSTLTNQPWYLKYLYIMA